MALYTVLESPDGRPEAVVFEREGFCLWAAIFMIFWALWNRMWVVAILLFAFSAVLEVGAREFGLHPMLVAMTGSAVALIFGFEARTLHIMSLQRAGYRLAGIISAESAEAAELQYFAARPSGLPVEKATPPAPMSLRPQHHDALGLFGSH